MEAAVRELFARYAAAFNRALHGRADFDEIAGFYASEFVAASPRGVMSGRNDAGLRTAMEQGYVRYRAIGTREMRILDVVVSPVDPLHCTASVRWKSVYARTSDGAHVEIDFDVHYLVQALEGAPPKIFGWITGDEEAELAKHGLGS